MNTNREGVPSVWAKRLGLGNFNERRGDVNICLTRFFFSMPNSFDYYYVFINRKNILQIAYCILFITFRCNLISTVTFQGAFKFRFL
jgi:hypothetical protein